MEFWEAPATSLVDESASWLVDSMDCAIFDLDMPSPVSDPSSDVSACMAASEVESGEEGGDPLEGWDTFLSEFRSKEKKPQQQPKLKNRAAAVAVNELPALMRCMVEFLRLDALTASSLVRSCDFLLGEVKSRSLLVGRSVRSFLPAILLYALHLRGVQRTSLDVYWAAAHAFSKKPPTHQQVNRWFQFLVKALPIAQPASLPM